MLLSERENGGGIRSIGCALRLPICDWVRPLYRNRLESRGKKKLSLCCWSGGADSLNLKATTFLSLYLVYIGFIFGWARSEKQCERGERSKGKQKNWIKKVVIRANEQKIGRHTIHHEEWVIFKRREKDVEMMQVVVFGYKKIVGWTKGCIRVWRSRLAAGVRVDREVGEMKRKN